MMLLVVAVLWACAAPPPGGYALVAMTSDPFACHGLLLHARSYAHSLNHKALQHMGVTHILNVNTSHRFHSTPCEVKHVPMSDYGTARRRMAWQRSGPCWPASVVCVV